MIEKIRGDISDKEALLAILVARMNELIEVANRAEEKAHYQQSSWD